MWPTARELTAGPTSSRINPTALRPRSISLFPLGWRWSFSYNSWILLFTSPVTLDSFTFILLSTNNMPGTVPGAEIQQGANRQKLCPRRSFIIVRELDRKPCKLHTTRWYKWYRDKSKNREPEGGSGQKGCNSAPHGQRKWHRSKDLKEIRVSGKEHYTWKKQQGQRTGVFKESSMTRTQWAWVRVMRNKVRDIERNHRTLDPIGYCKRCAFIGWDRKPWEAWDQRRTRPDISTEHAASYVGKRR